MTEQITTEDTNTSTCACGARRARSVRKADRYCSYGDVIEAMDYELLRCLSCGLVRTSPQPADEDHAPFRDASFLAPYLERSDLFERYLRTTVEDIARLAPPPGRFVDVGANVGMIVRMAGEAGYRATGVELNEAACDLARADGLEMIAQPLEHAGFAPASLDVVCLSATAEHIPDLDETFALCRSLLRPGGLLYVSNSPNYRSFGARWERDLWYGIQPIGHVWQFTPTTLRAAFERTGFRVVGQRTYNLHRDFGRNRKERLRRRAFDVAEAIGLGDALSMAGVRP